MNRGRKRIRAELYTPKVIEPRWQRYWEEHQTFRTPDASAKPKFYILDMFPYPSGAGLHVGHPEGYTATDILARYRRMRGYNVLHPMGWDAFGLPAEQYAIQTGTHPRMTTQKNIDTFRRQIKMLGFSYDWDREVDTTDPGYFKWTQWIFLDLFDTWYDPTPEKGRPIAELPIPPTSRPRASRRSAPTQDSKRLAYQAEVPVNWCPALGTVLANEEVIDGKSERGGHPVVRMPLRQWLLRITAYADRLLDRPGLGRLARADQEDAARLDRPSEGAEVDFSSLQAPARRTKIRVFTTRPDTLFGATYMVLAPEHPLVDADHDRRAEGTRSRSIKAEAARKSDLERTELAKKKTGVFTGAFAINPVNGETIPIWIADYVLATLRHRRDHGGAGPRRARLRVRQGSSACRSVPVVLPPRGVAGEDERLRAGAVELDARSVAGRRMPVCSGDAVAITRCRCSRRWSRSGSEHEQGPGGRGRAPLSRHVDAVQRGVLPAKASRSTPGRSTACRPRSSSSKSPTGWSRKAAASARSTTSCATGCSAGSATGASRSRSCTSSTRRASRPAWSSR